MSSTLRRSLASSEAARTGNKEMDEDALTPQTRTTERERVFMDSLRAKGGSSSNSDNETEDGSPLPRGRALALIESSKDYFMESPEASSTVAERFGDVPASVQANAVRALANPSASFTGRPESPVSPAMETVQSLLLAHTPPLLKTPERESTDASPNGLFPLKRNETVNPAFGPMPFVAKHTADAEKQATPESEGSSCIATATELARVAHSFPPGGGDNANPSVSTAQLPQAPHDPSCLLYTSPSPRD